MAENAPKEVYSRGCSPGFTAPYIRSETRVRSPLWVVYSRHEPGLFARRRTEIELRPKSFDILRYLVERPGQLLSKDELMQAICPNLFVTDNSLTRCISDVRQALGHEGQRMIKTVPKRGYLFAVPVQTGETVLAPAADAPATRELIEGPSVAVLPFTNLSGDAAQDYLSDGITEDIINELSCFSGLSVIARHSSFSFKAKAIDVREIGRQLGVRYIVEGSVRRFGDRIRISAQLVDAESGVQRWTERFDRALGDVFAVQDEITQAIVRIVVSYLGAAEQERVARKPTNSWTTYDLLMQGDGEWRALEQRWAIQALLKAHQLYQRGVQSRAQQRPDLRSPGAELRARPWLTRPIRIAATRGIAQTRSRNGHPGRQS